MKNYLLTNIYVRLSKEGNEELELLFYNTNTSDRVLYFNGVDFVYKRRDSIGNMDDYEEWKGLNNYLNAYKGAIYIMDIKQNFLGDIFYIKLSNEDLFKISYLYDVYQFDLSQAITIIHKEERTILNPMGKSAYESIQEDFDVSISRKIALED